MFMNNIAVVFPGQGSQFLGMAKDLYLESPEIFDLGEKIFKEIHQTEISLLQTMFEGPEELLFNTKYTQPAILLHSLALVSKFKDLDKVKYCAGHSLGEFAALYLAQAIKLEDLIRLVISRAKLMSEAPAGAMLAIIGAKENIVDDICSQIDCAWIANYNAPDQIVCTGTKDSMQILASKLTDYANANSMRIKTIALNVSGAFHSPFMETPSEAFAQLIDSCDFNKPNIPIVQNYDAKPSIEISALKDKLKKQMQSSVKWSQTVGFLLQQNLDAIVEIGPSKVLAGLIKKQNRNFNIINIETFADFNKLAISHV